MKFNNFPATAVLLAAVGILGFEYIALGKVSVMIVSDNADQLVPSLLSRSFSGNWEPLWDRFSAAGVDERSGADYAPINQLLFDLLPAWLAYGLHLLAQYGLGATAVYLLCRRSLSVDRLPATLGALFFAATIHPYLASAVQSFMPVVILALGALLDRRASPGRWLGVGAAVLLVAWTGYFSRLIPYAAVTVVAWFLFIDLRRSWQDWVIVAGVAVGLIAVRARDIFAIYSVVPMSHAGYTRLALDPFDVAADALTSPGFLAPPTFAGLTVLMLTAIVFGATRRMPIVRAFALFVCASTIFFPLATILQSAVSKVLPFIAGYHFQYFGGLSRLAGAAGAALALQSLVIDCGTEMRNQTRAGAPLAWGAIVVAAVIIAYPALKYKYASVYSWVTRGSYARNFESPVLKTLAKRLQVEPFPQRVEPYQLPPAFLHAYGLETAGAYTPVLLRRYYEIWGAIVEPWIRTLGKDDFYASRFAARRANRGGSMLFRGDRLVLDSTQYRPEIDVGKVYRMNLLSLANVGYFVSRDRLSHPWLELQQGPETPFSALDNQERVRVNVESNFTGMTHLYVYRNRMVLPRFFTVERMEVLDTSAAVVARLVETPVEILRRVAFVEGADLPWDTGAASSLSPASITLDRYTSDRIDISIRGGAEKPSLLVVTNSYSPFWRVRVDGVSADLFPADHAFWGVLLPAGARKASFTFEPPYARFLYRPE